MNRPASHPFRFAVVTGAGAGIGRATALMLAAEGWRVGAFDLDEAALSGLAAEAPKGRILPLVLDVTDEAGWAAAVAAFATWSGGHLHLLVNNAGIIAVGRFTDISVERARRTLDVNVMGAVIGVHACLPLLAATAGARIVNVSSISALSGWPYSSVYSASKGALTNLTEALAAELAPRGIAVCDVLPSFVGTRLLAEETGAAAVDATFRKFIALTPPEHVARAVIAALDSRKIHHVVGGQARVYAFVARHLPTLARLLSRTLGHRYLKAAGKARPEPAPSATAAALRQAPPVPEKTGP